MLALLLAACTSAEKFEPLDTSAEDTAEDDTGDTGDPAASADCGLLGPLTAEGLAAPGRTLTLRIASANAKLAWSVDKGEVTPTADGATWALPADIALNHAVTLTARVHAEAAGCIAEDAALDVEVDWTDADRTVVVYSSSVKGSDAVAARYADFRGVDAAHLCAVASADPTNMAGADFPAFVGTVQACVDAVGPQVWYVVPVWGVPYRVSDLIDDIGPYPTKAVVSIDALLAYGIDSAEATTALWNPVYQEGDSLAGTYDPYLPFGDIRGSERDFDHLYLVARIDGASAEAAMALVDRTEAAEAAIAAGTLDGTVYVDANYGTTPPASDEFGSYDAGNWNMIGTRDVFEAVDLYPVVFDSNVEEFGTAPAPTTCPDALYYAGWYSYNNYNDAFTWTTGAIGGHLDSCSACDIRTGTTWSAMALQRGITATFGAVSEPYVAGMPEYDQFFLYLLQGASYGEAAYESTEIGRWMMVWVGDPLYRPYRGGAG